MDKLVAGQEGAAAAVKPRQCLEIDIRKGDESREFSRQRAVLGHQHHFTNGSLKGLNHRCKQSEKVFQASLHQSDTLVNA